MMLKKALSARRRQPLALGAGAKIGGRLRAVARGWDNESSAARLWTPIQEYSCS